MSTPRRLQADTLHFLLARANAARDCVIHEEMTLEGYDRMIARWVVDANIAPERPSRDVLQDMIALERGDSQDPKFRAVFLQEDYYAAQRVEHMTLCLADMRAKLVKS